MRVANRAVERSRQAVAWRLRVLTWVLLIVCIGGSVAAASAWHSSVRARQQETLAAQSSAVASSAALSLARLDDLTSTMRAVVSSKPNMTNANWLAWSAGLDVGHRYPASLGLAYAQVVHAVQLPAYKRTMNALRRKGSSDSKPFSVTPAGTRPIYCFVRLRSDNSILDLMPPGLDLCDIAGHHFLSKPRDSGQFQVTPVVIGGQSDAAIFAPVYRGGGVPATLAGRRANILGLVGGLFDIRELLTSALGSHHALNATLLRQDLAARTPAQAATATGLTGIFGADRGAAVGSVGPKPTGSIVTHTVTFGSDGRWTLQVRASDSAAQKEAYGEALIVLLVGLLLTLLAYVLVRVLVKGRQGALDLVERRTAELSISESRFRSLAAASPTGILQTDLAGRFLYGNGRLGRVLGRTTEALQGHGWLDGFTAAERKRVLANLHDVADGHDGGIDVGIGVSDSLRWLRFSAAKIVKNNEVTGLVSSVEDVTLEVTATERLKAEARHDALTGLPNRLYFLELLGQELTDLAERGGKFAVLFIDLDRFKQVNDTYGHAAGDELLIATGARISNALRPGDLVARLGGDEFAVLMPRTDDIATAAVVVDRLQVAVAHPFTVGGAQAVVGASVGLVLVDDPRGDPSAILQDADMAMYRAKAGTTRFEIFDEKLRNTVVARFETEQALRTAIDNEELALAYQPIIDLKSGSIVGSEALLRWNHRTRGLLLPVEFLPLAESTGLIVPIGDWTMRTAAAAAARWPRERRLSVAINFSAQQLTAASLLPAVEELLGASPIEPSQVCVEVLETHLLDDANIGVLVALKNLGIRVAIDDFGSGYSSLLYLKRMPADAIKIDRALIQDLAHCREDRIIVAKLIELAHELGMSVTGEGVESAAQADILRDLGCDFGQGFAWSPAVPEAEFSHLLDTGLAAPTSEGIPLVAPASRATGATHRLPRPRTGRAATDTRSTPRTAG